MIEERFLFWTLFRTEVEDTFVVSLVSIKIGSFIYSFWIIRKMTASFEDEEPIGEVEVFF